MARRSGREFHVDRRAATVGVSRTSLDADTSDWTCAEPPGVRSRRSGFHPFLPFIGQRPTSHAGLSAKLRHRPTYLSRFLVLPQTLVNDLPKQVIVRPSQVFDLGNELGANPMHAAQHKR